MGDRSTLKNPTVTEGGIVVRAFASLGREQLCLTGGEPCLCRAGD
ncbi:hypothetical protein [Microbulbifer sediminum]|nr:hypothetical protein [Microbulbifer sediminum]